MIRRSRISVRPNVKPAGRALTGSHDASLDKDQPNQAPADSTLSEESEVTAGQVNTAASEATNENAALSNSNGKEVEATCHEEDAPSKCNDSQATTITSGPQRRKRFTALPNLAKPRAFPASVKISKSPSKSPVKPATPSESEKQATVVESALGAPLVKEPVTNPKVPERHKPSGGGRQPKAKPTPAGPLQTVQEKEAKGDGASEHLHPLINSQPDPVILHEIPLKYPVPPALDGIVGQSENNSGLEEDQSENLLREKLKSCSKFKKSMKVLNDPADMIRLAKARKLRELLKMEKSKEDKKKTRMGVKESRAPKDHTKMTMRELIYYLPASNPMKSFSEEDEKASEIVLPNSPQPTSSKPSTGSSVQETGGDDDGLREDEEAAEMAEETHAEEEEPLMVPRVKVAEDGSLIIDEESLTVQVSRMKGPNPAEDRDPIFERGSTTTYSSFRKGTYTKPWSNGETDMFYLAISMVGTDFSMIGQLFPHRARVEIKNKFKKEERMNSWRIDKAFKEKRRLDLEFFKTLMEQVLKDEQTKKEKNKELVKLGKAQRTFRKPRVAKKKEMESSERSDSDEVAGEKENEDLWNDGGGDAASKKHRGGAVNAQADLQDCDIEVSEALPSEDTLKESENVSKSPVIKPTQLKGRLQRPTPTLSNRYKNRCPSGEENKKTPKLTPVSVQGRENKQSAILHELEDLEEEPDLTAVQEQIFNKPTRSGRIPKLSQHVMQAAVEEDEDEEELSEPTSFSKDCGQGFQVPSRRAKVKPGLSLKKGMTMRGKSRLVTLWASGTDDDDDEEDVENCDLNQEDFSSNTEEENQVFVPMSLRSLQPDNSEVEETVEELDISVNVPDILGTSQNAFCPELSCQQSEMSASSVPCEHQLDLLVDVIDFLDPDHMEVCKEINNEAAQTLLTIGNLAQAIQTTDMSCTGDYVGEQSLSVVQEEVVQEEVLTEAIELQTDTSVGMSGSSVSCDLELPNIESHIPELSFEDTSISTEQPVTIQTIHAVPIQDEMQNLGSSISTPPSKRGRFSKPKPNVGQGFRTRQAQQQQAPQEPLQISTGLNSTEQNKNTAEPMQEDSDRMNYTPPESSSTLTEVMQTDSLSKLKDGFDIIPGKVMEEDSGSVPSLKRKRDDVITEQSVKKDKQERAEAEPEQLNSVSVSQERLDETSKPVRRYRGPKPKPNLTRTFRPTQTQTHQKMTSAATVPEERLPVVESSTSTFTCTKNPEEGTSLPQGTTEADVSQSTAQQEEVASNTQPVMAIKDITPQVVSEDELKLKTVTMLGGNTRSTSEGNGHREPPVCMLPDTSADLIHDEPVFILSLTEIPTTFDEGMGFETDPLPSTAVAKLQSQSANESRETSHLLITDALVPVMEEEEKESKNEDEMSKGDLDHKVPASRYQMIGTTENQTEHHELDKTVTESTKEAKKHLEKKKELPERARRAKLQVKPNTVTKRSTRGAKVETPAISSKDTPAISSTSTQISTSHSQETISEQEQNVQASISTTVNLDILTSAVTSDGETDALAQGQVDLAGKDAVILAKTEAGGWQSQDVGQTVCVDTSGPLTRPGRRPKGFLSFISSKSAQGPPGTHRGAKPGPQKPAVNTLRPERKQAITITKTKHPEAEQPSTTYTSKTENSEEPTSVSKYFFSDIFTEVDELEDID